MLKQSKRFATETKRDESNIEFRRITVSQGHAVPMPKPTESSPTENDDEFYELMNAGWELQSKKEFEAATKKYEKALKLKIDDEELLSFAYGNLAICSFSLKKFEKSLAEHDFHIHVAKRALNRGMEGAASSNKGLALAALGRFPEAVVCLESALRLAIEVTDEPLQMRVYANLGNTFASMGDFDNAIKSHEKQMKLAVKSKDLEAQARAAHNLENDHCAIQQYKKANEAHTSKDVLYATTNDFNVLLGNFRNSAVATAHSCWVVKHPGSSVAGPRSLAKDRILAVLKDGLFSYYRDIRGSQMPNRFIRQSDIISCEHWGNSIMSPRNFNIVTAQRVFWFTCATSDEAEVWIALLSKTYSSKSPLKNSSNDSAYQQDEAQLKKLASQAALKARQEDLVVEIEDNDERTKRVIATAQTHETRGDFQPSFVDKLAMPGMDSDRHQVNPLFGREESTSQFGMCTDTLAFMLPTFAYLHTYTNLLKRFIMPATMTMKSRLFARGPPPSWASAPSLTQCKKSRQLTEKRSLDLLWTVSRQRMAEHQPMSK